MCNNSAVTITKEALYALNKQFHRLNYTIDGLKDLLGDVAFTALYRHEPVPVWQATDPALHTHNQLADLVRFLLLGEEKTACEVEQLLNMPNRLIQDLKQWGFLVQTTDNKIRVGLDVRPIDTGFGTRWVFSDLDGALFPAQTKDDHVLGVGEASLSLLRATPLSASSKLLDLGTGCGIQALHAKNYAKEIVASDISPRCCELAFATLAINNQLDGVSIRQGSWFEPVANEKFATIVANPPFVVSSETITHSYRDSGLNLDGATQLMVKESPSHLEEGGSATILGSWIHAKDEDYRQRLSSWFPETGVDAWIVERDNVDCALYISTWMKDSGRDPADPQWRDYAEKWLTHFADNGVESIGFGVIYLRKTNRPTSVLIEELTAPEGDALATECNPRWERWNNLMNWDTESLLAQHFYLAPTVVISKTYQPSPSGQGTEQTQLTISRTDMPSYRHEIDEPLLQILNGICAEGLCIEDVAKLMCGARGWDWGALKPHLIEVIKSLYLHGFISI